MKVTSSFNRSWWRFMGPMWVLVFTDTQQKRRENLVEHVNLWVVVTSWFFVDIVFMCDSFSNKSHELGPCFVFIIFCNVSIVTWKSPDSNIQRFYTWLAAAVGAEGHLLHTESALIDWEITWRFNRRNVSSTESVSLTYFKETLEILCLGATGLIDGYFPYTSLLSWVTQPSMR